MDFKQLEVFAQVVEKGSFSKAAEALHLTQPTVSTHIQSLESELNTPLLVRTPRGAHASETGNKLYHYAKEMLALRTRALSACQVTHDTSGGQLAMAASSIPYQYLLPVAMSTFRKQYPGVHFQLLRKDSATAEQALLSGEAELALSGTYNHISTLCYQELCKDELVVITPVFPQYAERKNRPFSPEEFHETPYILRESGSGTRREAETYLKTQGIEPNDLNVVAEMDSPDAVKNAVSSGLGVSIVSRLSVEDFEKMGLLLTFRLGPETVFRPLYLVRHQKRPLSLLAKRFERHLLQLHQDKQAMHTDKIR